jgi:hypothetical protein
MTTSYNGWPASTDPSKIGVAPFTVAGRSFPGGVKSGSVATVLRYVVAQWHLRVESIGDGKDEWGYAYRQNRNANNLSCHASGTAVDVNAMQHPNGKRNTLSATQAATVRLILKEAGGVVRWGGDFTGVPDEMHLEICKGAAEVQRVAARLLSPAWFTRPLAKGMSGADVKRVQSRLKVKVTGVYDDATVLAVKRTQARLALTVTGKVSKPLAYLIG